MPRVAVSGEIMSMRQAARFCKMDTKTFLHFVKMCEVPFFVAGFSGVQKRFRKNAILDGLKDLEKITLKNSKAKN